MAFPTSPTNGQQSTQNGITYTWNSTLTVWALTTSTGGNISATAVTATANVTGGNLITGGTISVTGNIVTTGSNAVANIGSASTQFNTVHAKATSAQYADLAEWYEADADYEPGTVLVFGGDAEVTQAVDIGDVRVAGVVTTNPAHVMNSGLKATHTAAVALTGRAPTLVIGPIRKGDMMVTAGGGRAKAATNPQPGSVIGKALQDYPRGHGVIEIVVGRM